MKNIAMEFDYDLVTLASALQNRKIAKLVLVTTTMHFIGRVTMLFANNSLMECLITMKFLHIFFTP